MVAGVEPPAGALHVAVNLGSVVLLLLSPGFENFPWISVVCPTTHVQQGSPSSCPFVNPSPSESALQNAFVHERSPRPKANPKRFLSSFSSDTWPSNFLNVALFGIFARCNSLPWTFTFLIDIPAKHKAASTTVVFFTLKSCMSLLKVLTVCYV